MGYLQLAVGVFPSFSILRISIKKVRFLTIIEATVFSETPEMSDACGLSDFYFDRYMPYLLPIFPFILLNIYQ